MSAEKRRKLFLTCVLMALCLTGCGNFKNETENLVKYCQTRLNECHQTIKNRIISLTEYINETRNAAVSQVINPFTYTVTFDCNAGSDVIGYAPDPQTIFRGESFDCPPFPTREEYIFNGWYSDEECMEPYDFKNKAEEDLVVYAGWVELGSEEVQLTDEECDFFLASVEEMGHIGSSVLDENDVSYSDRQTKEALDLVENYVQDLYDAGKVVYYSRTDSYIYMEFASMIPFIYTTYMPEYANSGTDENIVVLQPFADTVRVYEDDGQIHTVTDEDGNPLLRDAVAETCADKIKSVDEDLIINTWTKDDVDLEKLEGIAASSYFLWDGHGKYTEELGPTLVTGKTISDWIFDQAFRGGYYELISKKYVTCNGLDLTNSIYICITSRFVDKYFTMEDNGFVFLNTCSSGKTSELADAFIEKGASVIVALTEDAKVDFVLPGMDYIISYMSGEEDGIHHTIEEAVADVGIEYQDPDGAEYKAYYANSDDRNYTICPGIRGEITFEESIAYDESAEILNNLYIKLETDDGKPVNIVTIESDTSFYFNNLNPGTYTATLYQLGNQICEPITVNVKEHRYTLLSIPYAQLVALEGYVYDQEGNPLASVAVNADMTIDPALWNTSALTDENGYYSLRVYGENTYTLSYTKEGYTGQEINYNVTSELFEEAQEGTPCRLEDVELSGELYALYADIVREYEATYGTFGLWLGDWQVCIIGVNYLRLVDMDGDGVEELLIGHDSLDYFIEVWTYKDDEAGYVGSIECHWPLWDLVVDRVYTTTINGTFAVFGSNDDGYTAWTYDGESLNAVATYTNEEFDNLAPSVTYINHIVYENMAEEKVKFMETWDTVLETKEALSCITDAEKALVAYQFTLLYDDTTGWFAVDDVYHLKLEYIYVDDDDIPELVVSSGNSHANGAYLYTYYDRKVKLLGQFGYYGDLEYSEKNNVILSSTIHTGLAVYYCYQIQNGAVNPIHYLEYSYDILDTGELVYSDYKIDNVPVSESVYNAALSEITDNFTFTSAGWSTGQYECYAMGDNW